MNRTRLMVIGLLALALGAFVSFSVYRTLQTRTATSTEPTADVVVAATDLNVGAKIEERDVRLAKFPLTNIPPGAFTKRSDVLSRGVIIPISRGEFILPSKVAGKDVAGMQGLIPRGMRAVSVRVNEVVAVAGFVQPGTRVDVLLTGNPGGTSQPQTTTVLENIPVIAAGQKLERNSAGEPTMTPVITLLVSPDDAQKLTLAQSQGHIQLALRNPTDTEQEDLSATKTDVLYKNVAVAAPPPKIRPKKVAAAPAAPPPPSVFGVEVIRGNKRDTDKVEP
jgi:pilus assembly protein CpaB